MTTNWSAEHHDGCTHVELEAERRPSPDCVALGACPVYCPDRKVEEFIAGSAPLSTDPVLVPHLNFFAHLVWAAGKKVTNLMCGTCGLIQWFGEIPQRR